MNSHYYTGCTFSDIRVAFDIIMSIILYIIQILSDVEGPAKVCKWIFSFLFNMVRYVKYNILVWT